MQNLVWKLVIILAVLGLCVFAAFPPKEKIRLGKDLQGGTSMVYLVNMPPETPNKAEVLSQTITVLKDRVNPQGVLDISMQPLGIDRIEIVMPLPSDEVKALKTAYDDALAALTSSAQISEVELDEALRFNRATTEFGGEQAAQATQIKDLQDAHNALQEARSALAQARATSTQPDSLFGMEQAVADALDTFETLRADVLRLSLDEAKMVRTLGLPREPEPMRDAEGKQVLDENGEPRMNKPQRDAALETLKSQFPQLAGRIDATVAAHDEYQARRTTLDDPEDLMRLLRGAGVLEFHIAVRNGAPEGVNVQDLRTQLAEVGPQNTDSPTAGWYPINSVSQWSETPADVTAMEADPRTYFSGRYDLVAERYNGVVHLLLYNTPAKSITHGATEWSVESTGRTQDELGRDAVSFRLDQSGGTMMAKLTAANLQQPMAIVLDGQVYTAPNINSQIGNSGIIQGVFSPEDLSYLIRVLAAGSLGARLSDQPIAMNTLGPSLGKDNLKRGLEACLLSLIVTAAIMLAYYFFAGAIANVALLCNALIIFGTMALMQATFTLPGLAGVALSIAMAVDANVLIYERIREELVNNKEELRNAIRLGYARALSAIIDGNLTNLIVCVVLLYTATTEVKGFAYTMTIGIIATLFCALFITRALYTLYTDVFGFRTLPMVPTVFPNLVRSLTPSVDWIAKRGVFLAIAAIVSGACLGLVWMRGSSMLDTEFRGGLAMTMQTRLAGDDEPKDDDGRLLLQRADVERRVHEIGDKAGPTNPGVFELRNATVLTVGDIGPNFSASRFQVKVTNPPGTSGEATITDEVQGGLVDAFRSELDVQPALTFDGSTDVETERFSHSAHTFPIEERTIGESIGRPQYTQPVGRFQGGVAVLLDNLDPAVVPESVEARIKRLRTQPDFSQYGTREVMAIGLEPADSARPDAGYRSIAVVVYDPSLDQRKVDVALWDSQLAAPEWEIAALALAKGSSLQEVSSFSPSVARTLAANAIVAVVLSVLGMLVYIWVRFGSLRYSMCTVLALAVNVICCLGALALSHYLAGTSIARALLIEEYRIDLNVIAALLTIIGYSLNDTIVILDRIRENRGKRVHASAEIINNSINQTFSRTILTGGSTILASVILFAIGGAGLQAFAFTFLVGLIIGTVSSVTIAAPLVYKRHEPEQIMPPVKVIPATV